MYGLLPSRVLQSEGGLTGTHWPTGLLGAMNVRDQALAEFHELLSRNMGRYLELIRPLKWLAPSPCRQLAGSGWF